MIWWIVGYIAIGIVCGICTTAFERNRGSDREGSTGMGLLVTLMWAIVPVFLLMLALLEIIERLYLKAADWIVGMIERH